MGRGNFLDDMFEAAAEFLGEVAAELEQALDEILDDLVDEFLDFLDEEGTSLTDVQSFSIEQQAVMLNEFAEQTQAEFRKHGVAIQAMSAARKAAAFRELVEQARKHRG